VGHSPAGGAVEDPLGHLGDAGEAGHHHGVGGQGPARRVHHRRVAQADGVAQDQLLGAERGVELGDVDRPGRHPGLVRGQPGGRRCGEVSHAKGHGLDAVVDPGDPGRSLVQLAGPVAGGQDDGTGAVADGWAVALAERVDQALLGQQVGRAAVPGQLGVRVVEGAAAAAGGHLGEVGLGGLAGVDQAPGLEGGQADGIGPQGGHVVRVELAGQHLVQRSGGGLAVRVDEGGVELAELQLHPRLVRHRPP
jgi:hypothetical protein